MSTAVERVLNALEAGGYGPRRNGSGWTARCPAHDDHNPSLSIGEGREGALVRCHAGCSFEAIVGALELRASDLFEAESPVARLRGWTGGYNASTPAVTTQHGDRRVRRTPPANAATVQPSAQAVGCTLAALAEAKRLPEAFLREQGLRDATYREVPAVRIPYPDGKGSEVVHFRIALAGDERFRWRSRDKARPYGLWRLELKDAPTVALVEGETDALTLWHHGVAALALPGAAAARDEAARALAHVPLVYVVIEPDQGGATLQEWLANSPLRDRARIVTLPAKDVSELHIEDPARFREQWEAAVANAIPVVDAVALDAVECKQAAWQRCGELAKAPRILDRVAEALLEVGLVGEQRAAKLLYLAVVSRLIERPLSIAVKGPSSAGKSFLVERVLKLFPPSAYYALTAMSDRALAYSDEPLVHRVLVLYEAAGIGGEHMPYMLRSLLSEGRICYETVEKTAQGMKARKIDRPGPTGLIATTTALRLDAELETRLLSIPVTDTPQQTADVLSALADDRAPEPDLEPWHALQLWLERAERDIVIPFAPQLAKLVPACAVRLRRDFAGLLNLVRAHALLHQAGRGRDEQGRIVATVDDYAVVRDLIHDLVSAGVQATVPATVRATVGTVIALNACGQGVTGNDVARSLKLDKSSALRRLRQAADLGYLRNDEAGRGRPACWVPDEPMPDDLEVLPAPGFLTNSSTAGGEAEADAAFESEVREVGPRLGECT